MSKLVPIKTQQTSDSVADFISGIADEQKRNDSQILVELMEKATKEKPKMWGRSMIGFGNVICKSPATGREVAWFKLGFSPRKANLSLHLMNVKRYEAALKELGKHKTGAGCLYINKLADIDLEVLKRIIAMAAQ